MCHPPSPLLAESNSPMDLSMRSAHLGTTDSKRVDAVSPGGVLSWQTAVYHALVPSSRAGGYILCSEHHIPTPPRVMGARAKDPESKLNHHLTSWVAVWESIHPERAWGDATSSPAILAARVISSDRSRGPLEGTAYYHPPRLGRQQLP